MAQHSKQHHPVLELIHGQHKLTEKVDHRAGQIDLGRTAVKAVAGLHAFRRYDALSETVKLNKAGNLRGMVVSEKWHTIFRHTSEVGEYMENIGYLAAIAAEIAGASPKFEKILNSSDSTTLKAAQVTATAGTIAQRALLGVIPAGAHLIYRSLEGWCMIAGLAGGKAQGAASQAISTLKLADTMVKTSFQTVTDTSNQSKAVWTVIDFFTTARSKQTPPVLP